MARSWPVAPRCVIYLWSRQHMTINPEIDMNRFNTTLAMALLSLSTSAAFASHLQPEQLQQKVSYAQFDMSQPAAANQLYQKLHAAAKQVCEPFNGAQLRQKADFRACVDETLATAVAAVNKPLLSNVHASKTGGVSAVRVATK
jgi:UrcA family protein